MDETSTLLLSLAIDIPLCLLIALVGKNRTIGYGWSFVLCLLTSPIVGLIITLCCKRKKVEFKDM